MILSEIEKRCFTTVGNSLLIAIIRWGFLSTRSKNERQPSRRVSVLDKAHEIIILFVRIRNGNTFRIRLRPSRKITRRRRPRHLLDSGTVWLGLNNNNDNNNNVIFGALTALQRLPTHDDTTAAADG